MNLSDALTNSRRNTDNSTRGSDKNRICFYLVETKQAVIHEDLQVSGHLRVDRPGINQQSTAITNTWTASNDMEWKKSMASGR
jgi:hypothetical protein